MTQKQIKQLCGSVATRYGLNFRIMPDEEFGYELRFSRKDGVEWYGVLVFSAFKPLYELRDEVIELANKVQRGPPS